jgi:uncharacterized protein (UPF0548 family)
VAYRDDRLSAAPTCPPAANPPHGFHHTRSNRQIGTTRADFERARLGLQQWQAHRRSGIEVFPSEAAVADGATVAILTRQLGLWVLAACRVTSVVDEHNVFGFTYATLPGHPEDGYESFIVRIDDNSVVFDIEAVSRPGILLVRLATPVTRQIQKRATDAYLAALTQPADHTT